jgi:hypothetical protein
VLDPGDDAFTRGQVLHRAAPTLVRLSSSRPSAPLGEPLALLAQVRNLAGGGALPTGAVAFRIGTRLLGSAPLDEAGQAVLEGVQLEPGVHAVTASYAGDPDHAAATSSPLPQAVTVPAAPVVVLVCAPVTGSDGVLLEVELVDPHTGRLAEDAVGTVLFTADGASLGTADLMAGHARTRVAALPAGRLGATFPGDTEHAPATGFLADT